MSEEHTHTTEPPKAGTGVLHTPEENAQKAPDHVLADTTPTSPSTLVTKLSEVLTGPGTKTEVQVTDGKEVEILNVVQTDDRPPPPPEAPPEYS
ncbi:hypothetical protein HZC27_04090 [Candidatus Roizmanbacteria bacterium]|nr:hypothetical protein [Candidatus Roizmanbacteria bacterium]